MIVIDLFPAAEPEPEIPPAFELGDDPEPGIDTCVHGEPWCEECPLCEEEL